MPNAKEQLRSDYHGEIHWPELMTRNLDAAKSYYAEICGWTWQVMPMEEGGEYHIAMRGEEMVAGAMDLAWLPDMEETPPRWFTYVAVKVEDAAAAKTTEMGGQVIRAPFDVAEVGRVAIVTGPSGAGVGLMTPKAPG